MRAHCEAFDRPDDEFEYEYDWKVGVGLPARKQPHQSEELGDTVHKLTASTGGMHQDGANGGHRVQHRDCRSEGGAMYRQSPNDKDRLRPPPRGASDPPVRPLGNPADWSEPKGRPGCGLVTG